MRFGGRVEAGGGTPAGAGLVARRLIQQGVSGLVSFGLAGGLDPALRPGAIVVPRQVAGDGIVYDADAGLAGRFGGFTADRLVAGTAIVAHVAQKTALFAATGASAVDLESGMVARLARDAGVPFAVVRAICDPAERALPPAALVPLRAGGRVDYVRVLGAVIGQPWQILDLLAVGRDAMAGQKALMAIPVLDTSGSVHGLG